MLSEIKKWGNSAAIRLPSKLLAAAELQAGEPISIEVIDHKIVITSAKPPTSSRLKLPFTESELLADLDAHTAHADEIATLTPSEAEPR